ncbi:MAG: hypothetical protein RBT51_08000 [Ectothiorhodospiraceae bacterium]|jgi:cytochrome oxidase Cu insertion factor (SCO1/SenC/PrrC family)|nr:hypothetical protein [Ectothiorhodospiraceae bacterium]
MTTDTARPATRMLPLILLVVVIVAPALVATTLYLSGWRPGASSSHGELIVPPQPLPGMSLTSADGQALADDALHGKWGLLYLLPQTCATECRDVLLALRMVHVAQGREYQRVQRIFLIDSEAPAAVPEAIAELLKDGLRATADAGSVTALRQTFEQAGGSAGEVYLVDPLGNLILRYRPDADPKGMRKDLAHLLKHSWVG